MYIAICVHNTGSYTPTFWVERQVQLRNGWLLWNQDWSNSSWGSGLKNKAWIASKKNFIHIYSVCNFFAELYSAVNFSTKQNTSNLSSSRRLIAVYRFSYSLYIQVVRPQIGRLVFIGNITLKKYSSNILKSHIILRLDSRFHGARKTIKKCASPSSPPRCHYPTTTAHPDPHCLYWDSGWREAIIHGVSEHPVL
jgi:hypothetical protein